MQRNLFVFLRFGVCYTSTGDLVNFVKASVDTVKHTQRSNLRQVFCIAHDLLDVNDGWLWSYRDIWWGGDTSVLQVVCFCVVTSKQTSATQTHIIWNQNLSNMKRLFFLADVTCQSIQRNEILHTSFFIEHSVLNTFECNCPFFAGCSFRQWNIEPQIQSIGGPSKHFSPLWWLRKDLPLSLLRQCCHQVLRIITTSAFHLWFCQRKWQTGGDDKKNHSLWKPHGTPPTD